MLASHIDRFLARYPELVLELVTRDQLGDLVGEGFDIAVRFGQPPSSSLVAPKLLETRTLTVAAPLRKRGRPESPSDLAKHECILMRDSLTGEPLETWDYRQGRKAQSVKASGRLMVTEFGTMLGACLAGVGVARIKAIGIRDYLARGDLVELLPDWSGETFPLHALYPSRHLPAAKVEAFIDFVEEVSTQRSRPNEGRLHRESGSSGRAHLKTAACIPRNADIAFQG
jgi:DNA-binding transcriptional LysR family regulator